MVGVHYHCRTFLLTTFLCFCLVQHTYELEIKKIDYGIQITCGNNESLDSTSPARDSNHNGNETHSFKEIPARNRLSVESKYTPLEIVFVNCRLPNKPYLEILKDNNINTSRVSIVELKNITEADLLNESLFEGMSLKNIFIHNGNAYMVYQGKLDLANASQYNIYCNFDESAINTKPIFSKSLNVTHVLFFDCTPPNVSYSDILIKQNIRPSSVQELSLWLSSNSTDLKPDSFKGLSLGKLSVRCYIRKWKLDSKVFEELEANELYMYGTELTTLKKFTAKKVTVEYGKISGDWGDCSTLTSLTLHRVTVTTAGWLRHCGNLTDLTIKSLFCEEVERTLTGASALNTLFISESYDDIHYKGLVTKDAVNLRRLTIQDSYECNTDAFSAMGKLEELNILDNSWNGTQIFHAITPLQNLRKLSADRNELQTFCDDYRNAKNDVQGITSIIKTIGNMSLQNSELTEICFNDWVNLKYLDLRDNKIRSLQLKELPAPQNHNLTVDLRGNPLETLTENFHYEDTVKQFKGSNNITILLNWTMECGCEHTSFVRMLQELPQISLENATCTSGERLVDFAGEKFGCHKYSCHNCTCRSDENGTTIADCDSKNLNAFPAV